MYCPNCNSEVKGFVKEVLETYPVKGEDITITAHVRFCERCKKAIWDEELDSANLLSAFRKYREKHHLLQPDEIRIIRSKYGLSQVAFARVLGLGDKAITRYENGSIADTAQNNLIELMMHPSNFKELLEKNKDNISEQEYMTACTSLDKMQLKFVYNSQRSTTSVIDKKRFNYSNRYWGDVNYA